MSNPESHPVMHHENYISRGEKRVGTYAEGHVREYDSYDPRLVIDLGVDTDGKDLGKIIADNFPLLEWGLGTRIDKVELIRGHHKARLLFQIGNTTLDENGFTRHEVYSPDGLIGYAYGQDLDFYIASLFHDDPKIKERARKGGGRFDEKVQQYLEKELEMPGLFKK
jgi:hypothetical protein